MKDVRPGPVSGVDWTPGCFMRAMLIILGAADGIGAIIVVATWMRLFSGLLRADNLECLYSIGRLAEYEFGQMQKIW